ncbi:hypothetical protein BF23_00032 [Escherichia phage Bf23]|uniref:Uncharacterized protein n=1 Tax=Escherichia phage Bf23 TaxID=2932881 RepID=A0AAF0NQL0_BPBF2|nr:hypothetical protein BF23_00032 [Escherichia phage Bf23]
MERVSISILSFLVGVLIYSTVSLHTRLAELDNSIHELNVEMCKLVPNNEKCKDI